MAKRPGIPEVLRCSGKVFDVVHYRAFRNTDPPGLVAIWNEAFAGRGQVRLRHSSPLDNYLFAKPYFDPAGLIVALDDDTPIGFAHAGFGPNPEKTGLSYSAGVICMIGVRPAYRHRGVAGELLRRAETYLTERGAQSLYAGPMAPFNPFYFGLYGGSDNPGFLTSDASAQSFLARHGYEVHDSCMVFQRVLSQPLHLVDARFTALRRRCEVRILPRTGVNSWWQECVLGPVEVFDFRLEDKSTGQVLARAGVWEMDLFSWRWDRPAVGILDIQVAPELRHQGLAKYLLSQMVRHLQEHYFEIVEVQTMLRNEIAISLYRGLGFEAVDMGHFYHKTGNQPAANALTTSAPPA